MLRSLFPKSHKKILCLPLLGPIADGFDDWLAANSYAVGSRKNIIRMLRQTDAYLRRRRVRHVGKLNHDTLYACWRDLIRILPTQAGTVRTLERYLIARGLMANDLQRTAVPQTLPLSEQYACFLQEVRGFAASTVSSHRYTAQCFLEHLMKKGVSVRCIGSTDIESYIAKTGKRLSRGSLEHDIAALRGFLRFLSTSGRMPAATKYFIDTPRLYRLEKLPHALPWETVRALLRSMETKSPMGLRDYAMFLLIATYGLRASEIVAITLDDIRWRERILRIYQRKTSSSLELPLTNEVLSALVKHLKRTPPPPPYRRVFLRMRAPMGVLKPTAVTEAFQALVRKSGLSIPYLGPHCLRHSYAVFLLKAGTPLKTIGDILGHRTAESTSMYLRLATGDLREVALQVPTRNKRKEGQQ
jgi:site-specific recombinase XerD